MYSLPSTSHTFDPLERVVTIGYTISFQSCLKPEAESGSARTGRFCAASLFDCAVRRVYRAIQAFRARLCCGVKAAPGARSSGLNGPCDFLSGDDGTGMAGGAGRDPAGV